MAGRPQGLRARRGWTLGVGPASLSPRGLGRPASSLLGPALPLGSAEPPDAAPVRLRAAGRIWALSPGPPPAASAASLPSSRSVGPARSGGRQVSAPRVPSSCGLPPTSPWNARWRGRGGRMCDPPRVPAVLSPSAHHGRGLRQTRGFRRHQCPALSPGGRVRVTQRLCHAWAPAAQPAPSGPVLRSRRSLRPLRGMSSAGGVRLLPAVRTGRRICVWGRRSLSVTCFGVTQTEGCFSGPRALAPGWTWRPLGDSGLTQAGVAVASGGTAGLVPGSSLRLEGKRAPDGA